ncbi:hypothetical protein K1T71_004326 [Dendrolimus kikuchii]|uniref:Uncharacterized protein n=1 Tax=Dendrolimus kikuchii TaxID=765133 RepID=A0ACC1D7F7_9NEOP|nr:hypothetical protein K1T71_004326 [Dendrolimus kikuchii]
MPVKSGFLIFFLSSTIWSFASGQTGFLPGNVTLPPELRDKVNDTQIEIIQNKTKEHFKAKCEQNGGIEAYEKAQNAGADLTKCLQGLVDVSVLQAEIENAKPHGSIDEVFKKYCDKKQDFLGCAKQMLDTTKLCFSKRERDNIKIVTNITQQLAEFVCFKDGDRIALFIAEGGQECFEDKREDIQECSKSIFGTELSLGMQLDNITSENVPQLSFDKTQCDQLSQLQLCIVDVLSTCTKPTTANIVESLFKYVRNGTPCKKYPVKTEPDAPGSASGLTIASASIATVVIAALYL